MKPPSEQIPVYSLSDFSSPERKTQQFQMEVFISRPGKNVCLVIHFAKIER
jgi:hypothetical protein